MVKKVSYISLLKEAVGDYTSVPKTVDVNGPMLDDIIGYDGEGELKTKKDAASILERYYFSEDDSISSVNEEPDTEPAGDPDETKDGQGGDIPSGSEIAKDIAEETAGTLKEDEDVADEEDKDEEDKEDDKELQEAFDMMLEDEEESEKKDEDVADEEDKDEEEKKEAPVTEDGSPLKTIAQDKEDGDKELTSENLVLSKLIEQMEDATQKEPDTEPAGDPDETKDGQGKELDVDTALKDIKTETVEEMFNMFREQVEEDSDEEESKKKDEEKKEEVTEQEDKDEDEDDKTADAEESSEDLEESFFMEDEDETKEDKEEEEDKDSDKENSDDIKI